MSDTLTLEEIQRRITRAPFHRWLGVKVLNFDHESIELEATWREEWIVNPDRRYTHGGILATLIDLAADWSMISQMGRGVPTIDMRVDYHRIANPGNLRARGRVIKWGKTFSSAEAQVFDMNGALVASGRGTFLMMALTGPAPTKPDSPILT